MENKNILEGGWNINPILCDDAKMEKRLLEGFAEAFRLWFGCSFKPLLYCGSQLVCGINHMFICEGTGIYYDKTFPGTKVITKVLIHEDTPKGLFCVLNIETLATDQNLDGGWHIEPTGEIDAEIINGLKSVEIEGAGYTPLLLCAVSGSTKNPQYLLICDGSLATLLTNRLIAAIVLSKPADESEKWAILSASNIIDPVFKFSRSDSIKASALCINPGQPTHYRTLTIKDEEIFAKAMKGFTGVGYRPLVVSTQIINGLMRIYLCDATVMNASFDHFIANVYVAELFDGSVILEKIVKLGETMQEKLQ